MALDGLLEGGRSSALVKYEGKRDQDLVDEEIDDVILRLLGLEDVFDIDYGTYKTLLRERLAAARMSGNNIPSEEDQLIVEEFKRVKSKTGRFKVKKKKITSKSFSSPIKSTAITLRKKPLLLQPISQIKKDGIVDKIKDDTSNPFIVINKKLDSILNILSEQLKLQKKISDDDKKKKENLKRQKREESLEKGFKIVRDIVQKALKPFQSIFDRIWRFITFVLLGRAFLGLMKWLENPKNQKRIETLVRFIKDFWPAIATLGVLFFTPLGKLVFGTVRLIRGFISSIVGLIPRIAKSIKNLGGPARAALNLARNPYVAVPLAVTGAAIAANEITGQRKAAGVQAENKARAQTGKGIGVQGVGGVGDMGPTTPYGLLQGVSGGGNIFSGQVDSSTGETVSGAGKDTQLLPIVEGGSAVLQKGETVLQVGAREKMIKETGIDPLAYNVGPNANKPKFLNQTYLSSSGGILGFNRGGIVGMQGGGSTKVRAENPRMNPRGNEFSHGNQTVKNSLLQDIQTAQQRLTDKAGQINTNIGGWFKGLFPAKKETFGFERPGSLGRAPLQDYKMPGMDLNRWNQLRQFRETPQEEYRPNPKSPKLRYAPYYFRPGIDKPLMLQGGGEVERMQKTYKQGQRSGSSAEVLEAIGDEVFLLKHFGGVWKNFKGSGATDYRGNMIPQKQGGGLLGGLDNIGRSIFENVGGSVGKSKGRETGIPGGGWLGEQLGRREGRKKYEKFTSPFRGGLIKENSGMNIFGATADRQLTALQPGEYVLPVDTVNRLGTSLIDKLVALTDSNSTPAKLGKRSVNRVIPGPLSRSRGSNTMTLPPIMSGSGGGSVGSGNAQMNNSQVALFDIIPSTSIEQRSINAKIYGLSN